jgi:hypothetical protein
MAAMAELLARLEVLTRLVNSAENEIRVLRALPTTQHRERRIAELYRELDVIGAEGAAIERRLLF